MKNFFVSNLAHVGFRIGRASLVRLISVLSLLLALLLLPGAAQSVRYRHGSSHSPQLIRPDAAGSPESKGLPRSTANTDLRVPGLAKPDSRAKALERVEREGVSQSQAKQKHPPVPSITRISSRPHSSGSVINFSYHAQGQTGRSSGFRPASRGR